MNAQTPSGLVRALGIAVIFGAVAFVALIVIAGFAYPGYSHVSQMISELGGVDATQPWIQNLGFVIFGLTVMGLAIGLMIDAGKVFVSAILLGVLGLSGAVAEGLAHCDSGCNGATTEGAIHLGFGLIGFVCGIVAVYLLARRWRRDPRWSSLAGFARWCAWLSTAAFALFMISGGLPDIDGLAQRLFAAVLLTFVVGTGWRLASGPSPARSDAARSVTQAPA